jgi:hypothetical protein
MAQWNDPNYYGENVRKAKKIRRNNNRNKDPRTTDRSWGNIGEGMRDRLQGVSKRQKEFRNKLGRNVNTARSNLEENLGRNPDTSNVIEGKARERQEAGIDRAQSATEAMFSKPGSTGQQADGGGRQSGPEMSFVGMGPVLSRTQEALGGLKERIDRAMLQRAGIGQQGQKDTGGAAPQEGKQQKGDTKQQKGGGGAGAAARDKAQGRKTAKSGDVRAIPQEGNPSYLITNRIGKERRQDTTQAIQGPQGASDYQAVMGQTRSRMHTPDEMIQQVRERVSREKWASPEDRQMAQAGQAAEQTQAQGFTPPSTAARDYRDTFGVTINPNWSPEEKMRAAAWNRDQGHMSEEAYNKYADSMQQKIREEGALARQRLTGQQEMAQQRLKGQQSRELQQMKGQQAYRTALMEAMAEEGDDQGDFGNLSEDNMVSLFQDIRDRLAQSPQAAKMDPKELNKEAYRQMKNVMTYANTYEGLLNTPGPNEKQQ